MPEITTETVKVSDDVTLTLTFDPIYRLWTVERTGDLRWRYAQATTSIEWARRLVDVVDDIDRVVRRHWGDDGTVTREIEVYFTDKRANVYDPALESRRPVGYFSYVR